MLDVLHADALGPADEGGEGVRAIYEVLTSSPRSSASLRWSSAESTRQPTWKSMPPPFASGAESVRRTRYSPAFTVVASSPGAKPISTNVRADSSGDPERRTKPSRS